MRSALVAAIVALSTACVPQTPASMESLILARWAGTGSGARMVEIARCESGLNPRAKNPRSTASGLFQILRMHWGGKYDPFNPHANIEGAWRLWSQSGTRPWRSSRGCWA